MLVALASCGGREAQPTATGAPDVSAAGTAGATSAPSTADATPTGGEHAVTFDAFAGTYRLDGTIRADTCHGRLRLAAETIEVRPAERLLVASVVDRRYDARIEGQTLVAEGRFEARGTCDEGTLHERWTLRRADDATLVGAIETLWPLPPDCEHPCRIEVDVVGTPVPLAR